MTRVTRANATRIKTCISGLPMIIRHKCHARTAASQARIPKQIIATSHEIKSRGHTYDKLKNLRKKPGPPTGGFHWAAYTTGGFHSIPIHM